MAARRYEYRKAVVLDQRPGMATLRPPPFPLPAPPTSLVMREPAGPDSRYRLLETVRAYGRERLRAAGEEDAAHVRLRAWCLAVARPAGRARPPRPGTAPGPWPGDPGARGGPDVARLAAEQDALRAALAWCLAAAPGPGLELAAALGAFWHDRVAHDEGARWLEALLARAGAGAATDAPADPGLPPPASHVRAWYWLGRLLRAAGGHVRGRRYSGDQRTSAAGPGGRRPCRRTAQRRPGEHGRGGQLLPDGQGGRPLLLRVGEAHDLRRRRAAGDGRQRGGGGASGRRGLRPQRLEVVVEHPVGHLASRGQGDHVRGAEVEAGPDAGVDRVLA